MPPGAPPNVISSKLTRLTPDTMHLAGRANLYILFAFVLFASLIGRSNASLGDHLPDFKECVEVRRTPNKLTRAVD